MDKNLLIGAALALVVTGVGVTVGFHLDHSREEAMASEPPLLQAEPEPAQKPPANCVAPVLEGDTQAQILQRLDRIEKALQELTEQQAAMSKRLASAGELLEFFNEMRPRLNRARTRANQSAAIATMRNLISAQAQMQATGRIDTDRDGTGEFGGFIELSGAAPGRMGTKLMPPVLSRAFSKVNEHGEVVRSGYHYRIYLPDSSGRGVQEPRNGYAAIDTEADLAETTWCAYAWPADEKSGQTTVFFTNQSGDVFATQDPRYRGPGKGPAADAAFTQAGAITGAVAARGRKGADGNVWKQVN